MDLLAIGCNILLICWYLATAVVGATNAQSASTWMGCYASKLVVSFCSLCNPTGVSFPVVSFVAKYLSKRFPLTYMNSLNTTPKSPIYSYTCMLLETHAKIAAV